VELYVHSHNTPSWRGAQLKCTGSILPLPLPLHLPFVHVTST